MNPSPLVCDIPHLPLCRHGWNLTVLPNNTGSILRHLGAVPGKSDHSCPLRTGVTVIPLTDDQSC
jgi:hypothetical protein